jgi:hypothetical protein
MFMCALLRIACRSRGIQGQRWISVRLYPGQGEAGDPTKIHIVFPATPSSPVSSGLLRFANPHISSLREFVTASRTPSVSRSLMA